MQDTIFKKATAVWLVENTSLTFKQIADFCHVTIMEVQTIADGNYSITRGMDPIKSGQLTKSEITRCEKSPPAKLQIVDDRDKYKSNFKKIPQSPKNTSMGCIMWLVNKYPDMDSAKIAAITHSSEEIVDLIKKRPGSKISQVKPQSPVTAGLCTKQELEQYIS
jgi:uncharacterized protein